MHSAEWGLRYGHVHVRLRLFNSIQVQAWDFDGTLITLIGVKAFLLLIT